KSTGRGVGQTTVTGAAPPKSSVNPCAPAITSAGRSAVGCGALALARPVRCQAPPGVPWSRTVEPSRIALVRASSRPYPAFSPGQRRGIGVERQLHGPAQVPWIRHASGGSKLGIPLVEAAGWLLCYRTAQSERESA